MNRSHACAAETGNLLMTNSQVVATQSKRLDIGCTASTVDAVMLAVRLYELHGQRCAVAVVMLANMYKLEIPSRVSQTHSSYCCVQFL